MIECWKSGRHGHRLGEHFVMPRRTSTGSIVYGVWVVRTRARNGEGEIELLAEFRSKLFAGRWTRDRNAKRKP